MRHLLLFWLLFISVAGFGQKKQLMLPLSHSFAVSELKISSDGRLLFSQSSDDTKIWNIESGKLIKNLPRCFGISSNFDYYAYSDSNNNVIIYDFYDLPQDTLIGHRARVYQFVFSPDGQHAVSLSCDSTAKLWDLVNGRLIGSYRHRPFKDTEVKFSFDGKFAMIFECNWLQAIQLSTAKSLFELEGYRAVLNPTAHELAYIAKDTSIRIFNYDQLQETSKFGDHSKPITSVNYDPAGKRLVSVAMDSIIILRDLTTPRISLSFTICPDRNNCKVDFGSKGYTFLCGEQIDDRRLMANNQSVFSNDGKNLITRLSTRHVIIWDAITGRQKSEIGTVYAWDKNYGTLSELILPTYEKEIIFFNERARSTKTIGREATSVRNNIFLPFGPKTLINFRAFTSYWDFERGALEQSFTKSYAAPKILKNSSKIIATNADNDILIYDISTKSIEKIPLGIKGNFSIAPDESVLVISSSDHSLATVYSMAHKSIIKSLRSSGWCGEVIFTEAGDRCFVPCDSFLYRFDTKNWNIEDSIKIIEKKDQYYWIQGISPLGNHAAIGGKHEKTLDLFDLQLKKHSYSIPQKDHFYDVYFIDGKLISSYWYYKKYDTEIRNLSNGELLYEIKGKIIKIEGSVAISDNDTEILFWDIAKNQLVRRVLKNKDESLLDINVKEEIFLTEMRTSEVFVNSLKTGIRLYSIIFIDSTNYLVLDPEGRFDGTDAAKKMLYYVCGKEVIELEQLKDLCWEPDLVAKIMGVNKEPINAKKLSEIEICGVIPQIEEKGIRDGNYEFEINPQKGGVGEVLLFVNEKRVKSYKLSQLTKQSSGYLLRIPKVEIETWFVPGFSNRISVKANTADGTKSSRGIVVDQEATGEAKSPHLYLLCIGVNKYKDEQLRLTYAAKDAQDFQKVVSASAKKLFNIDDAEHIHPYVLLAADGSTTWAGKADIQKAFEDIAAKASPSDILLLFMAGHGVMTGENKQFYFLTAEATKMGIEGIEKEVAISSNELDEWMRSIKAQKQLLVMDACNSGKGQAELEKLYASRSVSSDQARAHERLKDRTGIFILAASAENQAAYEGGLYEQGFLTHSLLHTIKDGSAIRDNKFIDVNKWFNQSADFAEKLAASQGNRQTPRLVGHASFDIGMVDDSLLAQINLGDKKQFFTRSNFQNEETFNDDLNLSLLVDRMLKEISGRGDSATTILFTDANLQDAFKISGRYTVSDQELIVRVLVFKGSSTTPTLKLNLKAEKAKIDSLSQEIVEKVKAGLK